MRRILLTEDDLLMAEYLLEEMKGLSFAQDIEVVYSGEAALDYLYQRGAYQERPDGDPMVLLLDLRLPGKSGLEILQELRASARFEVLPVVILTASNRNEELLKCYRAGANACVQKPIRPLDFALKMKSLCLFWGFLNLSPTELTLTATNYG